MTVDAELISMMDGVLAAHREAHPRPVPDAVDHELWRSLDQLGLIRLTGSPDHGGSGAGWAEAAELISATVRHGGRVPLA